MHRQQFRCTQHRRVTHLPGQRAAGGYLPAAERAVRGLSHARHHHAAAAPAPRGSYRAGALGGTLTRPAEPPLAGSRRPGTGLPRAVIAVDAMGGDHAPAAIVAGAVGAFRDSGIPVLLTGRPGQLRPLLAGLDALAEIPVVTAEESLSMAEGAMASWRRPRSSIAVA